MKEIHITALEKIDILYLRKLFDAHSKTATETFYIETGKLPIRYIIKIRRLMYWWHITRVPETSLIQRFYKAQKLKPIRNDWVLQLEKDKKEFGINFIWSQCGKRHPVFFPIGT